MNHKNPVKSSISIFIATLLFTSLIFVVNTGSAAETTEIGMILSSETVSVGEEFTVTIYINPTEAIGGWEIYNLTFSEEYVTANGVTNGSEWPIESFDGGNIDNSGGGITEIQSWGTGDYPDYNHTACTISFTASNSGICSFELVRVQITDTLFVNLSVSTRNATITITGDDGGNGGNGGNGTSPNTPPVANASASETSGFVGMYIQFNGSLSYDPDEDGYIESWQWDFGDGEIGEGETTEHIYFEAKNYTVTLTVTDNKGATGTDTINVTIIKGPNIPPEKPTITGLEFGHKDIVYEYTANSTDVDNDTISYIFDWGDGDTTTTDFLPKGVMITQNHSWSSAGRYTITVQATDNQTFSQSTELVVMIDTINIGDIGYFTDDDGDEIYDIFHNETGEMTELGQNDTGSYLIDSDGDGEWDFVYNSETDELEDYIKPDDKKPAPFLEIIVVIIVIIFLIILILIFLKKKQNPKKPV
jgi:PKD repeat protein